MERIIAHQAHQKIARIKQTRRLKKNRTIITIQKLIRLRQNKTAPLSWSWINGPISRSILASPAEVSIAKNATEINSQRAHKIKPVKCFSDRDIINLRSFSLAVPGTWLPGRFQRARHRQNPHFYGAFLLFLLPPEYPSRRDPRRVSTSV